MMEVGRSCLRIFAAHYTPINMGNVFLLSHDSGPRYMTRLSKISDNGLLTDCPWCSDVASRREKNPSRRPCPWIRSSRAQAVDVCVWSRRSGSMFPILGVKALQTDCCSIGSILQITKRLIFRIQASLPCLHKSASQDKWVVFIYSECFMDESFSEFLRRSSETFSEQSMPFEIARNRMVGKQTGFRGG